MEIISTLTLEELHKYAGHHGEILWLDENVKVGGIRFIRNQFDWVDVFSVKTNYKLGYLTSDNGYLGHREDKKDYYLFIHFNPMWAKLYDGSYACSDVLSISGKKRFEAPTYEDCVEPIKQFILKHIEDEKKKFIF